MGNEKETLASSPHEKLSRLHPEFGQLTVVEGMVARAQFESVYAENRDAIQARFLERVNKGYLRMRGIKNSSPQPLNSEIQSVIMDIPRHYFALSMFQDSIPWEEIALVYQDAVVIQEPAVREAIERSVGEIFQGVSGLTQGGGDEISELDDSNRLEIADIDRGHFTIASEPSIVALMIHYASTGLRVAHDRGDRPVFVEVGSGTGYTLALASKLMEVKGWDGDVHGIEIREDLDLQAADNFARLRDDGYGTFDNIVLHKGDGRKLPVERNVDAIIASAAVNDLDVVQSWVEQMNLYGRIMVPFGPRFGQQLRWIYKTKSRKGYNSHDLFPVRFLPLV